MENGFLSAIPDEKITEEKINAIIREWIEQKLKLEGRLAHIYNNMLMQECSKATPTFVEMVKYYLRSKQEENYVYIVTTFIQHYEAFITTFKKVLENNRYNLPHFCYISLAWTEVVEEFLKEASNHKDMIASNIAVQLQEDINRIVDDVFENKKSFS